MVVNRRKTKADLDDDTHDSAKDGFNSTNAQNTSKDKEGTDRSTWLSGAYVGSYWLTRILFIRSLGAIYFVGFLIALNQNKQLIGSNGLLPANLYLGMIRSHYGGNTTSYWTLLDTAPTVFWWVPEEHLDIVLDISAYIGLTISLVLVIMGSGNVFLFASLWILYHSLCNIGQRWYSFGWESQLLEMGFLAMFMCPILNMSQFPRHTPTSWTIILGNRWMIFRIMLGAGLIKIRGDQCWRDLTCMNYHYETQPVPNPLSYYLHQSPEIIHKIETAGNHMVELIFPFLLFLPQPFCAFAGICQILFQIILILSGNLSFLNWLTILPSIYCFDDHILSYFCYSKRSIAKALELQKERQDGVKRPVGFFIRKMVSLSLGLLLAYLSIPVIQNLLSSRQVMNTSFNSLRILNTYGAFGSVTKERTEIIIEGTYDINPGKSGELAMWEELEFNCKPGNVSRRPCIISPYHYRLDWLMWFAAFQNYQHNPWLLNLCAKVLAGNPIVNELISHNPFRDKPPRFVRASHYRYRYSIHGSMEAREGKWWTRERLGDYLPIVDERTLRPVIEKQGWRWYTTTKNEP